MFFEQLVKKRVMLLFERLGTIDFLKKILLLLLLVLKLRFFDKIHKSCLCTKSSTLSRHSIPVPFPSAGDQISSNLWSAAEVRLRNFDTRQLIDKRHFMYESNKKI
jgi:hypothetical protein